MHFLELLLLALEFDDLEEPCLVVGAEDAARDLAEELLKHGGDRVHGETEKYIRQFSVETICVIILRLTCGC